jgi:hypothetical protein
VREGGDEIARRLDALGPKSVSVLDLNLEDIFLNAVADAKSPEDTI